jgi:fatty-acyl-CoA synthase
MSRLRTLPEALAEAARGHAGYIFVASGQDTRRSYAEIYEASRRVACALRGWGLGRGDLVALVVSDAEQFLTTLYGASIAGVIPASLYPPATTSDLPQYLAATAGILKSCGARAVVTTTGLRPHFDELRSSCPELSLVLACETLDVADRADDPDAVAVVSPRLASLPTVSADDIAFVQFTSGSTSVPKGVVVTHRNLSANIEAFSGPAGVGSSTSDRAVSWLPMYHDMGLVGMAIGAVYGSLSAVLLTPQAFVKRPVEWLRAISRYRGTVSFAPNFAYDLAVRRVKETDLEGLDLSCWRVAGCGAEPIHAPTLAAFAEKFRRVGFRDTSFLPSYGLAEHVLAATFPPRGRRPRVERLICDDVTGRRVATATPSGSAAEHVTVVSCGCALPGHEIRIADEQGRPLPERAIGEITLAGPSITPGYYRDEELTARSIRDGWLHTGDVGYLSNGELFVCGRVKDIIIVNGRKYHPQDLEWGIDDLAGIRRGRVVAFGTVDRGRADRAVIVVEPSGTVPPDVLTDAIRRRIVDLYGLLVDHVLLVPRGTVARTTSGKVRRAATKLRYERGEIETAAAGQMGLYV